MRMTRMVVIPSITVRPRPALWSTASGESRVPGLKSSSVEHGSAAQFGSPTSHLLLPLLFQASVPLGFRQFLPARRKPSNSFIRVLGQ